MADLRGGKVQSGKGKIYSGSGGEEEGWSGRVRLR